MLPLGSFKITRANDLQAGQFAVLKDHADSKAIVGEVGRHTVAVMLEAATNARNSYEPIDLVGSALVFPDYEIQIDQSDWVKFEIMDNPVNSLILKEGEVFVAAVPESNYGTVPVKICDVPPNDSRIAYGFRKWRIIHRVGDQEHILFEKSE